MSVPLYIQWNLGLGDAILCNGLVRVLNEKFPEIVLPAWAHNVETVRFMFRDLAGVRVEPVDFDGINTFGEKERRLRLGHYAIDGFDVTKFDQEFYRQAGVDFECRWSRFKVEVPELWLCRQPFNEPYAFAHDDAPRGFTMRFNEVGPDMITHPDKRESFFKNIGLIQHAAEVHCINSSFLILCDSLPPVDGQRLFLHHYARPTDYPTLKKQWTILS